MSRRSGRSRYVDQSEPTSEYTAEDEIINYEAEVEDEIDDDEQEVTRCVCGQDELNTALVNPQLSEILIKEYSIKIDQGLFIQCDKCSVWQHGYCVGLFTNDEVPDKYWCELCKPDLHVFIYDNGEAVRTLYRPVNEKRRKLSLESLAAGQSIQQKTSSRSRAKRQTSANSNSNDNNSRERERERDSANNGKFRKERRHYDESYDEQLQKALRESAKESGLPLDSETSLRRSNNNSANNNNTSNNNTSNGYDSASASSAGSVSSRRRAKSEDFDDAKRTKLEVPEVAESDMGEHEASNIEEDNEDVSKSKYETRRTKTKGRSIKPKKKGSSNGNNSAKSASNDEASNNSVFSKEELVNQPSKPRYVSDKLSIYELRKRTGAILEWLGRSQLELEDEKVNKIELFTFKEKVETDQHVIDEEGNKVIVKFDENLKLMETLTEKILAWEQKFGKYAP